MIMLPVTEEDLSKLDTVLAEGGYDRPTIKISIYKNRRGRYKGVYLWCSSDLGVCRVKPLFCTNYMFEPIPMIDTEIIVNEESAF